MNFRHLMMAVLAFGTLLAQRTVADQLHHYIFFNRDHEKIHEQSFLQTRAFEGAQLKFTWRELEPQKGRYDFSGIQTAADFLKANGKRLFVQVQDSSFDAKIINVPEYLLRAPEFNGGADKQFETIEGKDENAKIAGWVARRWDSSVQKRLHALFTALGKQFDGVLEGINLPETSVDFGETGKLYPKGFTPQGYRDAILTNMAAAKMAFPRAVVIQYANFMPGEWLPEQDHDLLRTVFRGAKGMGVGVGGPDLLPYKPGQMKHSYPLLREGSGIVPTAIAVQWGNYEHRNPQTGKQVTIAELIEFARDYLKVNYVFWCTQEPFYSDRLIPFLKAH
jgi:hypothetical protein